MVPGTHDNSHDVVVNRTTLIIHQSVYGICVSFELYRIIFGTRLWVLIILTVWYELAYSITSSPLLRFHLDFGYSHKSPSKRGGGGIMENWDSPNTIVMQLQLLSIFLWNETSFTRKNLMTQLGSCTQCKTKVLIFLRIKTYDHTRMIGVAKWLPHKTLAIHYFIVGDYIARYSVHITEI